MTTDQNPPGPYFIRLSEIRAQVVEWLVRGFLPVGALTLIDGEPGIGKSLLTLYLAALLTVGSPVLGNPRRDPTDVVIINPEDPPYVIQQRIEAAGGDPGRVRLMDQPEPLTGRFVDLSRDLPAISGHFHDPDVGLVVIDNVTLALGRAARTEVGIRDMLYQVSHLAQATSTPAIGVRHLRKAKGSALQRGAGFMAIVGTARSGTLLSPDPHDPDGLVWETTKSNLCSAPEAQGFRIVDDGHGPYLEWTGPTERTAEQSLRTTSPKLDAACDLLLDLLDNGPALKSDIEQAAARLDISPRTLESAKALLGIHSRQVPEPGQRGPGPSWWSQANDLSLEPRTDPTPQFNTPQEHRHDA